MSRTEHFPTTAKANLFSLSPFLIFVGGYLSLCFWYPDASNGLKLSAFPIFSCFAAIVFSFFTFREKVSFNKKTKVFISGITRSTVIYMCLIFIFSSIFSHIVTLNGGVDSAIKLCQAFIPIHWILPGIFAAISLFSLTVGTSIGTIATFMPIAVGISEQLGINPALMAGITVSAAMLGDNLSMISDTTLAAIKTTHCNARKKFFTNAKLIVPAFLVTLLILAVINRHMNGTLGSFTTTTWHFIDLVRIIPYLAVFILAMTGLDVLIVLVFGSILAASLGVLYGKFSFIQAITFSFDGFYEQKSVVAMVVLVMLIAGLSRIIEHNGGIKYLLKKFHARTNSKAGAEISIAMLVSLLDIAIARNTIAILIAGPIAQQIGGRYRIKPERIATLLATFACSFHGIIPYASQLLLAGAMADIASISIVPYLYYQFILLGITTASIVKTSMQTKEPTKKTYTGYLE